MCFHLRPQIQKRSLSFFSDYFFSSHTQPSKKTLIVQFIDSHVKKRQKSRIY